MSRPHSRVGLFVLAAVVVVVLAGGSALALAAVTGGFHQANTSPDGRCSVPQLPGGVVDVDLTDMGARMGGGMMGSGVGGMMRLTTDRRDVPAGTVSFRVANIGGLVHEMVVLPLAPGQQVGDRAVQADGTVDEAGSLGEASNTCGEGAGNGIDAGSAGWVTLDLAPGDYELVCNLPGHYAAGMYAELQVR